MKALLLAFLLANSATAQQIEPAPLTRLNFDSTEVYTMQRVSGYFKHPDGGDIALIVVRAENTGQLYRTTMRPQFIEGTKPGDVLSIEPQPLP